MSDARRIGKYTIEQPIGKGPWASVLRGSEGGKAFALKVVQREGLDAEALEKMRLKEQSPHTSVVRGELLNDAFWLHRVTPHAQPLVHVAMGNRPEIVLFGEEPRLVGPVQVRPVEVRPA